MHPSDENGLVIDEGMFKGGGLVMVGVVLFFVSVLLGDLHSAKKPVRGLWVPCSPVRTLSKAYDQWRCISQGLSTPTPLQLLYCYDSMLCCSSEYRRSSK